MRICAILLSWPDCSSLSWGFPLAPVIVETRKKSNENARGNLAGPISAQGVAARLG